jgi:hypothetical protein
MTEVFWFNDPKTLFTSKNFQKFVPSENQTLNEKFNTVTRFCIYFIILILLTSRNIIWIALSLTVIVFIMYLQRVESFNQDSKPPSCTMPTHDNPFMNFTMGDRILNPERPKACNINDPEVNKKSQDFFNDNLYKNSYDIFDREINSRPWITMPITEVINKQSEFAEWLFGNHAQCKSAGINCTKSRDLRYHKV